MNNELAQEILNSIASTGRADAKIRPIIGGNLNHILNLSSGAARIQTNVIKRFALIIAKPLSLMTFSQLEIRCALCKRVINYPCWYHSIKYAVNHFHYFICFDKDSPDKPSTKCYRKDV